MVEQRFIQCDADYIKELEEKAKKTDFFEGYIKGVEVAFAFAEEIVKGIKTDRKTEPTISKMEQVDEPTEITYQNCSDALLKMWLDNVMTDAEYNRIMDKLNNAQCKDQPQTEVKEVCDRPYLESCDLCWKQYHCRAKDEPQTKKPHYCKGCMHRNKSIESWPCIDCCEGDRHDIMPEDEPQTETHDLRTETHACVSQHVGSVETMSCQECAWRPKGKETCASPIICIYTPKTERSDL